MAKFFKARTSKGTISLTDFKNPELLTSTNGVYFLTGNSHLKAQPATGTVREGYRGRVQHHSLDEMASMMTAMRGFEANQHVIQIQDDRLGKVITDLGNPAHQANLCYAPFIQPPPEWNHSSSTWM